jgi:hypothetical protein
MINATELRIGNYLNRFGRKNQITWHTIALLHHEHKSYEKWQKEFEPIPLTEEWLTKFGFTEAMFDYTIHTGEFYNGSIGLLSIAGNTGKFQLQYEMKCTQTTIKYVHQLQNLYFALTGVELQLSST